MTGDLSPEAWKEKSREYWRLAAKKTQPQILLEEIVSADGRRADFASIEEQQAYWDMKDAEYEAYLNQQHIDQQMDTKRAVDPSTAQERAS